MCDWQRQKIKARASKHVTKLRHSYDPPHSPFDPKCQGDLLGWMQRPAVPNMRPSRAAV